MAAILMWRVSPSKILKMKKLNSKNYPIGVIFLVTILSFANSQNQSVNTLLNECNSNCTITKIQHDTPNLQFHHINYVWTVGRSHFNIDNATDYYINSPTFSATTNDKFKWYLQLEPNSDENDDEIKEKTFGVFVHLSPDSENEKARLNLSVALLNRENETITSDKSSSLLIIFKNDGWGSSFPKKDEYIFFDDKIKISFNFSFCEDIDIFDSSNNFTMPKCNLLQNFASLYQNWELADVVLLAKEKQYPAHKAVLSARSPVFASMFRGGLEKSKKIKQINITDLNDRVVEEMLRYIYTGKCKNNCKNCTSIASDLLLAAQKYDLCRLKMICVISLCKNLTPENAIDTLIFADTNGIDELRSNVIRFIAKKYNEISKNSYWQRVIETKPRFLHEICQALSKNCNLADDDS